MSKPNREVIERWVEALRSGRYKQGKGQLRSSDDKFCCLGVLCDLHAEEHGYEWEENRDGDSLCDYLYDGMGAALPVCVARWAGFDECGPSVEGVCLTRLNDGDFHVRKRSFNEIADMIEREWLG